METLRLEASKGRLTIQLTCVPMGRDLVVAIAGGGLPHTGAVALAQPRPSLEDGGRRSATASVLALLGHKEDELARAIALELAARLGTTVTVACGIHLDAITAAERADVAGLTADLARELAEALERPGAMDTEGAPGHHGG
ncbi:prenylated flavin chaperone LpdD [Mesoterricola sediminis]|uniref:Prenylated flavin chaperone LpdD-like domain-containing protein n=1 Tax=Mesoterricola sediminis TaxID=2927980 RepID=A0AA48GN15_9BACT|nr:hypothetical protein [Mesoterricola sediminis]BDU76091.1 hypothetical protein METESE_10490 [Mesoterricola sediminis]